MCAGCLHGFLEAAQRLGMHVVCRVINQAALPRHVLLFPLAPCTAPLLVDRAVEICLGSKRDARLLMIGRGFDFDDPHTWTDI